MHHGMQIARQIGGDSHVVRLFALLHDSQRLNEGRDSEHGPRAAAFVASLHRSGLLGLDDTRAELLITACHAHSEGRRHDNPTIAACWDADRLDLGRVGVRPDPLRMSTDIAAQPKRIALAWRWSRGERLRSLRRSLFR